MKKVIVNTMMILFFLSFTNPTNSNDSKVALVSTECIDFAEEIFLNTPLMKSLDVDLQYKFWIAQYTFCIENREKLNLDFQE